jgi:hypothetical protein
MQPACTRPAQRPRTCVSQPAPRPHGCMCLPLRKGTCWRTTSFAKACCRPRSRVSESKRHRALRTGRSLLLGHALCCMQGITESSGGQSVSSAGPQLPCTLPPACSPHLTCKPRHATPRCALPPLARQRCARAASCPRGRPWSPAGSRWAARTGQLAHAAVLRGANCTARAPPCSLVGVPCGAAAAAHGCQFRPLTQPRAYLSRRRCLHTRRLRLRKPVRARVPSQLCAYR